MTAALERPIDGSEALERATLRWTEGHSPCGVFTIDLLGRVRGWNHWMETHTGRLASEVVGRALVASFPELVTRGLAHYFDEALTGRVGLVSQRLHGFLLRVMTDSGGSRFECMQQSARIATLLDDGEIIGAIATITDVTDRVAREAELQAELVARGRRLESERSAHAAAAASNRAKDEFLAVLSHELRTPLHAILGWTQVLGEGRLAADQLAHGIAAIERNAQIQTQLVEDLLDVSRIISGDLRIDLRPVSLRRPIEAAVEVIRPAAEAKGIRLSVSIDEELGPVLGDAVRLQQVVWNLLANTVKFTPAGGAVSLVAAPDDGFVTLTVSDTGDGITAEYLPHVFERFSQSDNSATRLHGGLGLGLSIVHRLVELHGGTVTAASKGVGLGATFVVTLPRAEGDTPFSAVVAPRAVADVGSSEAGPLAGVQVLFVDDDPDGREIMALALSLEGAAVVVADSAAEARVALMRLRPDVLVSDIGMPCEDGYALMRSVRAMTSETANVPAIALTGYASLEDRRRAREAGFDAHLTKPADLPALIAEVARLAGR